MSILDINDTINNDDCLIRRFIMDNYIIHGTYTIKNGVFNGSKTVIVDVDGGVYVKNDDIKSLTNGLFRWGRVSEWFNYSHCYNLKSLKGASQKYISFICCFYPNLFLTPLNINIQLECTYFNYTQIRSSEKLKNIFISMAKERCFKYFL